MSLPLDERVFCSECGGEGGALRIVKGLSMLGHTSSPAKLHPFQLARSAAVATHPGGREDNQRQTEGLAEVDPAGNHLAGPSSSPKDRTVRGPRSDGSTRTATPPGSRSPARAERVTAGTPRLAAPRSARAG